MDKSEDNSGAGQTGKELDMTMTPEGKVKKTVKKLLDKYGNSVWYFMPVQTGVGGKKGIPDFVLCVGGKFVTIETKAKGNQPTALQAFTMNEIRDAGGLPIVVTDDCMSVAALQSWIEIFLDKKDAGSGR